MDTSLFSKEDLLLAAMKSEVESAEVYSRLSSSVSNFMLKDRFTFLFSEEEKHRTFFEWLYAREFPNRRIVLPEKSPVPLPQVRTGKGIPLTDVLEDAMRSEQAAHDFYTGLAGRFADAPDIQSMLFYIASMERGHYKILEVERDNTALFESFEIAWPMTHVGP